MYFSSRLLVRLWIIGFVGALLIQSIFQQWFADSTVWGPAPGWQSEIAIWNLGMICVLIPFAKTEANAAKVVPGLVLLSLLFGLNHFQAALKAPRIYFGNYLGASSNLLVMLLGVVCIAQYRRLNAKYKTMNKIITKGLTYEGGEKISFEPFQECHIPLLIQWLKAPHVKQFWHESEDEEELRKKYLEKLGQRGIQPQVILVEGRAIGFIQSYEANKIGGGWWPNMKPEYLVYIS